MISILTADFMVRALLAAFLTGLAAPAVGWRDLDRGDSQHGPDIWRCRFGLALLRWHRRRARPGFAGWQRDVLDAAISLRIDHQPVRSRRMGQLGSGRRRACLGLRTVATTVRCGNGRELFAHSWSAHLALQLNDLGLGRRQRQPRHAHSRTAAGQRFDDHPSGHDPTVHQEFPSHHDHRHGSGCPSPTKASTVWTPYNLQS